MTQPTQPPRVFTLPRLATAALIGPVLIGVLSGADYLYYNSHEPFPAFFAAVGGCWGLTAGVLRKSLKSALVGLNLGAMLGYSYFEICDGCNLPMGTGIVLLLLFAAVLGAALNSDRGLSWKAASDGALSGAGAFCVLALVACLEIPIQDYLPHYVWTTGLHWVGMTLVSVAPTMAGLTVFLYLFADELPQRLTAPQITEPAQVGNAAA